MKKGLLLINIGTPETASIKAVRQFLKAFLSDKRVIDLPTPLRYLLLYAFILPFRPQRSTLAYKEIWMTEGSPLLVYSQQLIKQLQTKLGNDYQVVLGMRYGNPNIKQALSELKNCKQLTILPLFPQYSSAATGSSLEEVLTQLSNPPLIPQLNIINEFYAHPQFIQAQASMIKPLLTEQTHILFSYHGIPERQIHKIACKKICISSCKPINEENDACYRAQCYQTSRLLALALNLPDQDYSTAFQSRLGKTPWIKPFTDQILVELIAKGIKNLIVACPSFVTDCLETLEEIGIRAKQQWLLAGGNSFTLVPCLNANEHWVDAIISLITS
jgi:ferrochelatase